METNNKRYGLLQKAYNLKSDAAKLERFKKLCQEEFGEPASVILRRFILKAVEEERKQRER